MMKLAPVNTVILASGPATAANHTRSKLLGGGLIAVLTLLAQPVLAAAIDVTPSNMGNWAFDNRGAPTYTAGSEPTAVTGMVIGPATPPLGVGSAQLQVGNGTTGGDGAAELGNTGYAGTKLSDITALSYSTYDVTNNGQQFPFLRLYVSFDGGATLGDSFFFEAPYQTPSSGNSGLPNQGATAMDTWQNWDALAGGWWSNNGTSCSPGTGVQSLADCVATDGQTLANSVIFNPTATLGGVRFGVGLASPGDQFLGYVDNFTIGVNSVNTTFNFDPNSNSVPEPMTLTLFGAGLAGAAALRRRKKAQKA